MTQKLTPADEIQYRLQAAWDPDYYMSLYSQACYAFGEPYDKVSRNMSMGDIPDWTDITVRYQEIGRSRRILNAAYLSLSKNLYSAPVPDFTQVDTLTAEVRKQIWLNRHREGEWQDEMSCAYFDFDQLGLGFCQAGLKINDRTGLPQTTLRHSPIFHTLWDRNERNPGRAGYVGFVHYVTPERAKRILGAEIAKQYTRQLKDTNMTYPVNIVRFIEYFDLGFDGGTPTRALIPEGITNKPCKIEINQYGRLPMSYGLHILPPLMRRPIGRIPMQMATQEALNEIERHFRKILRRPTFDIADVSQLDENDLMRVRSGDTSAPVKWTGSSEDKREPFIRVPSAEVAASLLQWKSALEMQYNADAGTNDAQMGNADPDAETLGENMLIDQRSEERGNLMENATIKFAHRTISLVMDVAKLGDRDPLMIDLFGQNVMLNNPMDIEMSNMGVWLEEPSDFTIDPKSLRKSDTDRDMVRELRRLEQIAPLVGTTVDPFWFTKKKLEAIGIKDPSEAMMGGQMSESSATVDNGLPGQGVPTPGQAQPLPGDPRQERSAPTAPAA